MFTPARDRNAPFDVDDVAGLVGRLGAHAPVPIQGRVVVVVAARRCAANAEDVAARAPHDEVNRASSSRGGPGVRAVVAATRTAIALGIHTSGGHAVRVVPARKTIRGPRRWRMGAARSNLGAAPSQLNERRTRPRAQPLGSASRWPRTLRPGATSAWSCSHGRWRLRAIRLIHLMRFERALTASTASHSVRLPRAADESRGRTPNMSVRRVCVRQGYRGTASRRARDLWHR